MQRRLLGSKKSFHPKKFNQTSHSALNCKKRPLSLFKMNSKHNYYVKNFNTEVFSHCYHQKQKSFQQIRKLHFQTVLKNFELINQKNPKKSYNYHLTIFQTRQRRKFGTENWDEKLSKDLTAKIAVVGVGGAGGNAINNMISQNLQGITFIAANTDGQALTTCRASKKILLGETGLGAGALPSVGRELAQKSLERVEEGVGRPHMLFIAAGLGGGTGTGAGPVIAKFAKEKGILTVGVVTTPFDFEGLKKKKIAEEGLRNLEGAVDTLIVIPNQKLLELVPDDKDEHFTYADAFKKADSVLYQGVKGISDLVTLPGVINLDFADVETTMKGMGRAIFGIGESEGKDRAIEAVKQALENPLISEDNLNLANGCLINVSGGKDLGLHEVNTIASTIQKRVDKHANIIFGSSYNEDLNGKVRVSVILTGLDKQKESSDDGIQQKIIKFFKKYW